MDSLRQGATRKQVDSQEKVTAPVSRWFDDAELADKAYRALLDIGYDRDEINVVMSSETRERLKKRAEERAEQGTVRGEGVEGTGAETEEEATQNVFSGVKTMSAIGAIGGAIAGIGASIILPGVGLIIIGPLAGLGAGLGALLGNIYGIPLDLVGQEEEKRFTSEIEAGRVLLSVTPHSVEDAERIGREWDRIEAQGTA